MMVGDCERTAELTAHSRYKAADDAWSHWLQQIFCKRAGDVRYTKEAHGEPGSALRKLYDDYREARDGWYKSLEKSA